MKEEWEVYEFWDDVRGGLTMWHIEDPTDYKAPGYVGYIVLFETPTVRVVRPPDYLDYLNLIIEVKKEIKP